MLGPQLTNLLVPFLFIFRFFIPIFFSILICFDIYLLWICADFAWCWNTIHMLHVKGSDWRAESEKKREFSETTHAVISFNCLPISVSLGPTKFWSVELFSIRHSGRFRWSFFENRPADWEFFEKNIWPSRRFKINRPKLWDDLGKIRWNKTLF